MARRPLRFLVLALSLAASCQRAVPQNADSVATVRVPNGGLQPQVVLDEGGTVHLIYFSGAPEHGDLFYVRSADSGATFSQPIRVNGEDAHAIAIGTVRGARVAVGRNGRVYVAWNGARPTVRDPRGGPDRVPMLFTRLNDSGTAFEPARNLIQSAFGIDGGGAVAADSSGRVYVFWHAPTPGTDGEDNRRLWIARSTDDGATFEAERLAFTEPTGACGCCSIGAVADRRETIYTLFRSARELVHRDMFLLTSTDRGQTFEGVNIAPWNVGYCVMSTESMLDTPAGVLAAWETSEQVYFGAIDPATRTLGSVQHPDGEASPRKHPVLARNANGDVLLAWTEGMAWQKPGTLAWQVFSAAGSKGSVDRVPGVPVWSLVAAFARPDGGFTVVY